MTGAELRQRREALGLSLRGLAAGLEVSPNTINDYELGKRAVPRLFELAMRAFEQEERTDHLALHHGRNE